MRRYGLSIFGWAMFLAGVAAVVASSFLAGLLLMLLGLIVQPPTRRSA